MPTLDEIGEKYYKPLDRSEFFGGCLFWICFVLSISLLLVDKSIYSIFYDVMLIAFIACSLMFFLVGQVQRLYFFPRAEDRRRRYLISDSYGLNIVHDKVVGYYNNDQEIPLNRLAASVMENSFFTSEIVRKMLMCERVKASGYLILYVIAILNRATNLDFLAVIAQVVFSEEIISRWLRMEWLRIRSEKVFEDINLLFSDAKALSRPISQSLVIEFFSFYETTKSTAAILLSSLIFNKHNEALTEKWEQIRRRLDI